MNENKPIPYNEDSWRPQDADKEIMRALIKKRVREAAVGENVTFIPAKPMPDIMDAKNKKVAVYTRVSTSNLEQVSSIENQTKYYTEKVEKTPNWELQEIYSDEGKSGTSIKKRANFQRMLVDAQNKKFDLILCASVSRFARNIKDCLEKISELKLKDPYHPVGVYFETENIYTLNPDCEEALDLHAMLAAWESKNKSRRMILSYDQRICTGQYPVSDLLGYRHTINGDLILHEDEAKTVKFIFLASALGYSYNEIAKILTAKQRPILKGRTEWNGNMVRSITKNERRWGDLNARKTIVVDYKSSKVIKNNQIRNAAYVKQHHEAIISPQIAKAVHFITSSHSKLEGGFSEISVIKEGALKGFITISPYWNAIDNELLLDICKKAYSDEEFLQLQHEANILQGKEHSNIYSFKYSDYQVPYGIYFMNNNTPSLTINNKQIKFNKKCHEKLGKCEYIEILYHPIMQTIILKAVKTKTSSSFKCITENGNFSNKITTPIFCNTLYENMDWIKKYNFKFRGILRERGQEKILMFFLDEPQILAGDDSVLTDNKSVQYIKFKNNDSTTNTLGKIYPLRKRRDKLADTITESDITVLGETIENPKIGKIPTKFEIKQELDELLKVM